MWLKITRYFILILSILSHGILGTLATGNLIFGGLTGVDLTINAFTCLLGMSVAVFMMIIILVELNQRDATTATLLFESIWVGLLWATNAIAASFISKSTPAKCLHPHHMNWKWDVCVTYSLLVPASWISATVVTAHVVVLVVLVQWHRSRGSVRSHLYTTTPTPSLWARVVDMMKDEALVMGPILDQSVYVLLKTRSAVTVKERSLGKEGKSRPKDLETGPKQPDHSFEEGLGFPNDPAIRSPYSDAPPAYLSPPPTLGHQRFDSFPDSLLSPIVAMYIEEYRDIKDTKFQLRDEPSFEILTVPQAAQPPIRVQQDSARARIASRIPPPITAPLASSPLRRQVPSPSPSSPRFPTRSRTLPTGRLATPPPARYPNGDATPVRGLSRAQTIAGTRRHIPSRYGQIDLVAAGYIDRWSVGSPGPSRLHF